MTELPTATRARDSRDKFLRDLGIEYPFWIFDVDQPAWPRKFADILPNSRPARLIGWLPGSWEYGTSLARIDDRLPYGASDARNRHPRVLGSIEALLNRLRYDDTYDLDAFTVHYEGGSAEQARASKSFREWVFDVGGDDDDDDDDDGGGHGRGGRREGYVAPRRVLRIERQWDAVPMWDREAKLNLFDDPESAYAGCYGVATLVHNDAELLAAAGVDAVKSESCKIRKAEFHSLGDQMETLRGVVWPDRQHEERGLYLSRGPQFPYNIAKLAGTALEGAPWSEVEDYVYRRRTSPLW